MKNKKNAGKKRKSSDFQNPHRKPIIIKLVIVGSAERKFFRGAWNIPDKRGLIGWSMEIGE